jgi:Transcription factor WhiB
MNKHEWKDDAACLGLDINLFFDKYEEDETLRPAIEEFCSNCPLMRQCFAVGISQKEWGVWGGVYLENGKVSREFGKHKTKTQWAETWKNLTNER